MGKDCAEPGGGCCGGSESSSGKSSPKTPGTPRKPPAPDNPKPAPETPKKKPSVWDLVKKGGELYQKVKERMNGKKSGGGSVKLPEVKVPKGPSSKWSSASGRF